MCNMYTCMRARWYREWFHMSDDNMAHNESSLGSARVYIPSISPSLPASISPSLLPLSLPPSLPPFVHLSLPLFLQQGEMEGRERRVGNNHYYLIQYRKGDREKEMDRVVGCKACEHAGRRHATCKQQNSRKDFIIFYNCMLSLVFLL